MFTKYTSIENTYRDKFLNILKSKIDENTLFIIQEKIHWANYSFQINKDNDFLIQPAWRNWLLNDLTSFYNHWVVFSKYKENINDLFLHLQNSWKYWKIDTFAVFWELFWGSYPHENVEIDNNSSKIQKWISYTNKNEFLCFDIKINWKYMNLLEVEKNCKNFNIPFDPILFTGTLKECLDYPNDFQSIIWTELYNLPKIEDNVIEGTVIKPIENFTMPNWTRAILKNKNSKWTEKIKKAKIKTEVKLSEQWQEFLDILWTFINENRIDNVFSKIWNITNKDFWKIVWLYSKDIMEEFNKDYSLEKIEDKNELKKIKRLFQWLVSEKIRERFKREII